MQPLGPTWSTILVMLLALREVVSSVIQVVWAMVPEPNRSLKS